MSYYDDPRTSLEANIASQRSVLVDYKYTYKRVINTILATSPEDLSDDIINQQVGLLQSIRQQKELITTLENNLQIILQPEVVPQIVITDEAIPPLVDLSNNEIVPPLLPEVVPPLVDLSGNIV